MFHALGWNGWLPTGMRLIASSCKGVRGTNVTRGLLGVIDVEILSAIRKRD